MATVVDDLRRLHHVQTMAAQAPTKIVNLTHRDSGRIVTVRVTQELLVEPIEGFDADFSWAEHRVAARAAVIAGDHTVFELWPDIPDV